MKRFFLLLCLAASFSIVSCNEKTESPTTSETPAASAEESKEDKNIATAKASVAALNEHNVDAVFKDAAPDVADYGDGNMPAVKSLDSLKMMMKGWSAAFPDFKVENSQFFADGNKVLVLSDCSGTWKGDFMGQKPTNKSFKFKDVDVFTFNDKGQITEHRSVQNMGPVFASVGVKM